MTNSTAYLNRQLVYIQSILTTSIGKLFNNWINFLLWMINSNHQKKQAGNPFQYYRKDFLLTSTHTQSGITEIQLFTDLETLRTDDRDFNRRLHTLDDYRLESKGS